MIDALKSSFTDNAKRNAFCINDQYYTYTDLKQKIESIYEAISLSGGSKTKRIAIVTTNSIETYASIFACWFLGLGYISLNPLIPKERNAILLEQSGADVILTSQNTTELVVENKSALKVINTSFLIHSPCEIGEISLQNDSLMYILFTSGSTGVPKGVPISYGNIISFLESYNALGFDCNNEDRFLQMFDLTFDVSVASYLVPLLKGACVYPVDPGGIKYLSVYKILLVHKITFASLVPSILNYLKPYFKEMKLPFLRYCILTAEASNADIVKQWESCIPNARIFNLYGPTEATIWCIGYEYDFGNPKSYNQMLAIGKVFKNVEALIIDETGINVAPGNKGDLCIASDQLTCGYLNNEYRNKEAFFVRNGKRFYRTGDLVYKDIGDDIYYCGRIDQQVKINGFRIELSEIELAVREKFDLNTIAITYKNQAGVEQIGIFLEKFEGDTETIKKALEEKLPYYMIPSLILNINDFPYNNSGKIDRIALKSTLLVNE